MTGKQLSLLRVSTHEEWDAVLAKEKELTRMQDSLTAERRRLPMVAVEEEYTFYGPEGEWSLLDLFHDRCQLIVYSAMLEPGARPCTGCSIVKDNRNIDCCGVRLK